MAIRHRTFVLLICLILAIAHLGTACDRIPPDVTTETSTAATTAQMTETIEKGSPLEAFTEYSKAWERSDFESMYTFLTAEAKTYIDAESFVTRYANISEGIAAENIRILPGELLPPPGSEPGWLMSFAVNMDTLAGNITVEGYLMRLVEEMADGATDWKIVWDESLIFPGMTAGDRVRARILQPKRGEIRDRYNQGLAVNGELIRIGIVPERFNPVRDEVIPQMAEILGISEDYISRIADNATVPDWFYPVVTLPGDRGDLSAKLTAFNGVIYQRVEGRVYPGGIAAGLLTGYIGPITAEELERHPDQGYTAHDSIGKMGLELALESRLRGERGGEIYIVDAATEQVKKEIARKNAVNGDNIKLTVDLSAQWKIYNEMKEDAGSAAALDPRTGEILALVSTPSFDPNLLVTYVPDDIRAGWNETDKNPFLNRFRSAYAPGSVFKLVTAAVGLKEGTLDPDEAIPISGRRWQPDAGWGGYHITRVKDPGSPVDLDDAILYSDNIYFAMQALRAGAAAFERGASAFGIGEALPIEYPFNRTQLANQGLARETLLADTGYGQGEILVSTLNMALIYSTLANEGNLLTPVLEIHGDTVEPRIWHEQAVAAEDVTLLKNAFIQTIENPAGTGYTQPASRHRLLGKTGTAELKSGPDDEDAEENGWFIAMNTDLPRLVIAMMIEDVKDRGGSRYVVPLVKRAIDNILQ